MRSAFLYVLLALAFNTGAQVVIAPASNSCTCDGAISFTSGISTNTYYEWSDLNGQVIFQEITTSGSSSINSLCSGVYFLEYSYDNEVQTLIWNVPSSINPGNASQTEICETAGNFTLSSLISGYIAGGVWTDLLGNPVTNIQSPALLSGTEIFLYTFLDGLCETQTAAEVFIIENAEAGQSTTYLICENYVPFLMTDVLTGSPDYGGQWFNNQGEIVSGWYDPSLMDGALFTYMVDVIDGCNPVFSSLFVIENQMSNAGVDDAVLICSNAEPVNMFGLLNGNPEPGGLWYDPNNFPVDPTYSPELDAVGDYTYVVTGETPCPSITSHLNILSTPMDPAGNSASHLYCETASVQNLIDLLEGNPLVGGNWTAPDGSSTDVLFDPGIDELNGTYTYSIQIDNCPVEVSYLEMEVEYLPNGGIGSNQTLCQSEQPIDLNAFLDLSSDGDGIWTIDGSSVQDGYLDTLETGEYQAIYHVDGIACPSDEAQFTLEIDEELSALNSISISVCETIGNIDLDLYMGQPSGAIVWTDGAGLSVNSDYTIPGPDVFNFLATIFSGNSCPDVSATASIDVQSINAIVQLESQICSTADSVDLNTFLPAVYLNLGHWTNSQSIVINPIFPLEEQEIVSFQYLIDSVNACGQGVYDLDLSIFEPYFAGIDLSDEFCSNQDPIIWPFYSMGADEGGTWSYLGSPVLSNYFDPIQMPAGEYEYSTAMNGPCPVDQAIFSISVQEPMDFYAGPDVVGCNGDPAVQIGQEAVEGCVYDWTPSFLLSSDQEPNPIIGFVNEGDSPIEVPYIVSAGNGICNTSDTLLVTIFPQPEADISGESIYCVGSVANLSAVGNAESNSWSPFVDENNSNISWIIESEMEVELTSTNAYGCQSITAVNIQVEELSNLILSELIFNECIPAILQTSVSDITGIATDYIWSLNGEEIGTGTNLNLSIVNPGVYELGVSSISSIGCEVSVLYPNDITVVESPHASFSFTPQNLSSLQNEAEFTSNSLNYTTLEWSLWNGENFSGENLSYIFNNELVGNFEVCLMATNDAGCNSTHCELIPIDADHGFYAPNAFTPDNDGLNDYFAVYFTGLDPSTYHLRIINRWGSVIFESSNPNEFWMGNVGEGKFYAQNDSYIWRVQIKDQHSAEEYEFDGVVTIIR